MNPEPVTLDAATAAKFAGANGHSIPLCNPSGGVVAYGVSPDRLAELEDAHRCRLDAVDRAFPPEEIARMIELRKNDTRPMIPHAEVMRWIESL